MKQKISLAIHGGAGTILKSEMTSEKEAAYLSALSNALHAGYAILEAGGTATDAVENAVMNLEDCPLFNAGKGAVFNSAGKHELDASIMDGKTLMAGAVGNVSLIRNPVHLARTIMEKSEHVYMSGSGAEEFARMNELMFENEEYFFDQFRYDQWIQAKAENKIQMDHVANTEKKFGTVGAVALDANGNLAAATSTGGMTNKKFGRVGDTPIIGAGTYANNLTCGVSCTGHGEFFIRSVVAYDVHCLMAYRNMTLAEACHEVVKNKLVKMGGEGGLIAIDKDGNIELCFNSAGMYRGWKNASDSQVMIYE